MECVDRDWRYDSVNNVLAPSVAWHAIYPPYPFFDNTLVDRIHSKVRGADRPILVHNRRSLPRFFHSHSPLYHYSDGVDVDGRVEGESCDVHDEMQMVVAGGLV